MSTDTALLNELGLNKLGAPPATVTQGVDAEATAVIAGSDFPTTPSISGDGKKITINDVDGFEIQLNAEGTGNVIITALDAGALTLQIGANEGQSMEVRIPNLSPEAIGIDTLNMATVSGAKLALERLAKLLIEFQVSVQS